MKKILAIAVSALSLGAFAAANDILISFSTPGTDTYKDGSTVLDGECYALVFSAKDAEPLAIGADGSCTSGNEIVLVASLAKGGKCPAMVFELPAEAKYENGTFAVYLLDTRVTKTTLAAVVNGFPQVVNSYAAATASEAQEGQGGSLVASGATQVETLVKIDAPVITAMKVEGAKIKISVAGMSPAATYKVVAGTTIDGVSSELDAKAEGDTFTIDAKDGNFFKIIGGRNFGE